MKQSQILIFIFFIILLTQAFADEKILTMPGGEDDTKGTPALSKPNGGVKINDLTVTQLHKNYDDIPHKYRLDVRAFGSGSMTAEWKVNCGYITSQSGDTIEWHYDKPGECINPKVEVIVTDTSTGVGQKLVQSVFNSEDRIITDIKPEQDTTEKDEKKAELDVDTENKKTVEKGESQGKITFKVKEIIGTVDFKGVKEDDWVELKPGSTLKEESFIQAHFRSEVILEVYDPSGKSMGTVRVGSLTQCELSEFKDGDKIKTKLDIKFGKVKIHLKKGIHTNDFRTSVGVCTGAIRGTIFTVSYNNETSIGIFEVEEGIVEVTNHLTNSVIEIKGGVFKTQAVKVEGNVMEVTSSVKTSSIYILGGIIFIIGILIFTFLKSKK